MSGETSKKSIGNLGEDLACEHLKSLKYEILKRNIREKFGEIDILAKSADRKLHFVEVKTISMGYADYSGMTPEDNLSSAKLRKMKKMAEWYANAHPELFGDKGWQIDLVAISMDDQGSGGKNKITLYLNIA